MVCRKWNEKEKKEKKRIIRGRACCLEEPKEKKIKKFEGYTSYVSLLEEENKLINNKSNVNSRWEEGKDKTKRIQEVLGREVGEYLMLKEIIRGKTINFKV
jgi:hypothetical protein